MEQKPLTMRDIGKRGGESLKVKYGREAFVQRGKTAGERQKLAGRDFSAMGKLGGPATRAKHPKSHYENIGEQGGIKLRDEKKAHDSDYYRRIGKLGQEAQRKKKQARLISQDTS